MKYLIASTVLLLASVLRNAAETNRHLSPTALAATSDGKTLLIACATANRVLCVEAASRKVVASIPLPESPTGLVLSPDGWRLYVTCAAPVSQVCVLEVTNRKIAATWPAGHTAISPVLSPDGKTLYVCNRFNHDVSVIDAVAGRELRRIPVRREPVAADPTKDGRYLLVANHLPAGAANQETVSAVISVIDTTAQKVVKELPLPNGGGVVNDLRVSPDGHYAAVTHLVASYTRPTTEVKVGWMCANGLTFVDLDRMQVRCTLLLDMPGQGAANPWGLAWSGDGRQLVVTHAGTHEISLINYATLLPNLPDVSKPPLLSPQLNSFLAYAASYDRQDAGLPFLVGGRTLVKLPEGDLGPRGVVIVGDTVYIANYFSDTLTAIDLRAPERRKVSVLLGEKNEMDEVRKGEFLFHDARICWQSWQSCASCHPDDARVDGFNWDLLNDGVGNPKNTKSLLLAHQTPPAMSLGVRGSAEVAVRSGIKHILFAQQPDEVPKAMDAYLKSLKPLPSPYLERGRLSASAQRGQAVFTRSGCADCHTPPLFTDRQAYNVGTNRAYDKKTDRFDTPTLIEVWRTAPYLHDGSAATVREVWTTRNKDDQHGQTSKLSAQELDDLCAYVMSL